MTQPLSQPLVRTQRVVGEAGTGTIPAESSYVPSAVGTAGQDDDKTTNSGLFTELNIKLRGYKAGCDITTGRIIGSDIVF